MRERTAMVTVIPYAAGAHASMAGDLRLMEFEDAPPAAYRDVVFGNVDR